MRRKKNETRHELTNFTTSSWAAKAHIKVSDVRTLPLPFDYMHGFCVELCAHRLQMNNQPPPAIAGPPPLPVQARKRPPVLGIIIFAAGATVLTALNLLFGFLQAMSERSQGYTGEHYVTGYVSASILIPAVIALLVAAIWKSNRRPFRLLVCYFWAALVMLISKIPPVLALVNAVQRSGPN
jgi:hypothetical protein